MTIETPKRSDAAGASLAPPERPSAPPVAGPAWLLWLLPLLLCLPCLLLTVGGVAVGVAVVGALTRHAILALALGALALAVGLGGAVLLVRRRAARLCGDTCPPTAGARRPAPDR
jgi:hypothetical protein